MPLQDLLQNNKAWVAQQLEKDPDFFNKLGAQHAPEYLWIGCSDARMPANTLIGKPAGDVFVHRNVGNVVLPSDSNVGTVIAYAVEYLKVKDIIITGHYDCGAVKATLDSAYYGKVEHWLTNIKTVAREHQEELQNLSKEEAVDRLCELNVKAQVRHVAQNVSVVEAWKAGQDVRIHGWIYDVKDGFIKDLNTSITGLEQAKTLESSLLALDV